MYFPHLITRELMFLIGIEVLISKSPQINSAEKGPKKFPKYYF